MLVSTTTAELSCDITSKELNEIATRVENSLPIQDFTALAMTAPGGAARNQENRMSDRNERNRVNDHNDNTRESARKLQVVGGDTNHCGLTVGVSTNRKVKNDHALVCVLTNHHHQTLAVGVFTT